MFKSFYKKKLIFNQTRKIGNYINISIIYYCMPVNTPNSGNSVVVNRICRKRLEGDIRLLKNEPLEDIEAFPEEDNILVWNFLIRGPDFSDYAGGHFIGKVMHNPDYPLKGPDFMMLTPSGRFEINKKICLTNSGYHQEEWSAMWNIKTILIGFLSILLDDTTSGIAHIKATSDQRKFFASTSNDFNIKTHRAIYSKFTRFVDSNLKPITLVKPVVEKPVVEKPVVEKPNVEKPNVEKPVVEKPVVEKPVVEKPAVAKPVVLEPIAIKPVEKPIVPEPVVAESVKEAKETKKARGPKTVVVQQPPEGKTEIKPKSVKKTEELLDIPTAAPKKKIVSKKTKAKTIAVAVAEFEELDA
jgi:ubiquitin-protein ligase